MGPRENPTRFLPASHRSPQIALLEMLSILEGCRQVLHGANSSLTVQGRDTAGRGVPCRADLFPEVAVATGSRPAYRGDPGPRVPEISRDVCFTSAPPFLCEGKR